MILKTYKCVFFYKKISINGVKLMDTFEEEEKPTSTNNTNYKNSVKTGRGELNGETCIFPINNLKLAFRNHYDRVNI